MVTLGAIVAVIEGDRVLLTRRHDFEVWCLPGGHVDDGESLAGAAMREVREETGLAVELTHLVGVYSKPGLFGGTLHLVLFAGRVVGGTLQPQPEEVVEVGHFGRDDLPALLVWGHREAILDAFDGIGGSIARSNLTAGPPTPGLTRATLEPMRAASGLSRADFYLRHLVPPSSEPLGIDIEGHPGSG
jgi:ADP-ribose pyrophosphatase YjhB (NUDIX family)